MSFDVDLFVIGAGSGGVRAARMAAATGAKVAVAEEKYLGGTCVNVGCVPKKLMVYASHYQEDFNDAYGFGWTVSGFHHNWQRFIDNKNQEISRLNGIYQSLLENAGVTIYPNKAEILGAHAVKVGKQILTAEKILVCTGGYPTRPDIPGKEHVIVSDDLFYLKDRPSRIAIIGGGYIACEFASIFQGLGSETHLLYRGDQLLKAFDHGVATFVANEMEKKGVNVRYGRVVESVEKRQKGYSCLLDNGETLIVDTVFYAIGRTPNIKGLGLENAKVEHSGKGYIQVDENFQTKEPSIFALGDVIGTPELTPVALEQAMVFVDQQFGSNKKTMRYDAIPTTIFTQPNLGTCGLSEEQVKDLGLKADVYVSEFRSMKHCLSGNSERTQMKLIVDQTTDQVLGVHIAGPDAGEMVQGFAVAIKAKLTKAQWDDTIGIHPTAAEELVTMRSRSYVLNSVD